jgi:hypothetical protein
MRAQPYRRRRHSRRQRGQSIIESLICLMILMLVFFTLTQIAYLYNGQFVANHAAFVSGRSHVVGFHPDVVQRAKEVGVIPLAGHVTEPTSLAELPIRELGAIEPTLIGEFVKYPGYLMYYEHWPKAHLSLPLFESELINDYRVRVTNYPVEMPMSRAFLDSGGVDFEGRAQLLNHAAYYLE